MPAQPARRDVEMGLISAPDRTDAMRKLIAVRAYELWENQGRPRGRDVLHWHQAEQEIMGSVATGDDTVARRCPGSASTDAPRSA